MPDEAPVNQETPESSDAPEETGTRAEPTIDYEQRYNDLRSEFDRRNQQYSEFEQALANPDDLVRSLGYEIPDDQADEFDDLDPVENLRAEVEQLKADREAELGERDAAQLEQAELGYINEQLNAVVTDAGRDFTQEEIDAIGDLSRVRADENGRPDVRGAYDLIYGKILKAQKEHWVKSKDAPQVPGGGAAVENPDLDNPRERQDYFAARLAQIDAEQ